MRARLCVCVYNMFVFHLIQWKNHDCFDLSVEVVVVVVDFGVILADWFLFVWNVYIGLKWHPFA